MTTTYSIDGYTVVPIQPAGQFNLHLEDDTVVIERRYYGTPLTSIDRTQDRVETFRVPASALRTLLDAI